MQAVLVATLGLAGLSRVLAHCWWGCENGDYEGRWSWTCECDEHWEGSCCDKPICQALDVQTDVDLDEWTRATWYIQEQQVNGYQPMEDLYCVAATYARGTGARVPFFRGKVISVYNYANVGVVNGPLTPGVAGNQTLCARLKDPSQPGKLSVAPCFLPNALSGPYWIIAIGKSADGKYDWAIVIAGEPTEADGTGCTTKTEGINGAGLWLLSRRPVAPAATISAMKDALEAQGVSTMQLRKVEQKDCLYTGAFIKP